MEFVVRDGDRRRSDAVSPMNLARSPHGKWTSHRLDIYGFAQMLCHSPPPALAGGHIYNRSKRVEVVAAAFCDSHRDAVS